MGAARFLDLSELRSLCVGDLGLSFVHHLLSVDLLDLLLKGLLLLHKLLLVLEGSGSTIFSCPGIVKSPLLFINLISQGDFFGLFGLLHSLASAL